MKKGFIFTAALALVLGTGVAVGAHSVGSAKEAKADTTSVTLAGSFNGWSTTAEPLTLDGDYWTIEKSLTADDTFKIVVNGSDWVGDGDGVTWCSGMGSEGKGQNFKVLTAGTYLIKAAKTIGDYGDKSYGIVFENVVVPFDPTTPHKVKVGEADYATMAYDGTFIYDIDKTGHRYLINGVAAGAGTAIQFKAGDDLIHPGASNPGAQGGQDNNLITDGNTIQTLVNATSSIRLYRYENGGYDSFFGGYSANEETFYFTNNYKWEGAPKYYVFDALDNSKATWPGEDMTFVDVDGDENSRYSFTVDTNRWTGVVINGGGEKTRDYTFSEFTDTGACINGGGSDSRTLFFYHFVPATYALNVGGSSYTLEPASGNQYVAHNVDLPAGTVVTYSYDGVEPTGVTAKAVYNNNLSNERKVVSSADDVDVYVDVSSKTIWAEGLPTLASGFHLYVNTTVHPLATRVNEYSQTEYYSTLLTFAAEDQIRFIHIQDDAAPVIFGNAEVEGGEQAANFEYESEIGCIVAQNTCSSALYFKPGTPNNVWFADVSQELKEAREFAQGFNTSLGAVCNAGGSSDKDALYTAWEAQKTAFLALDAGDGSPQDILKKATSSHDVEDIAKFIAKYEYITAKYGSYFASKDASYNFLGEGHVPASLYGGLVDNNNSVPTASVIAIVAVVSVLSISAIVVLVSVKKRKHN